MTFSLGSKRFFDVTILDNMSLGLKENIDPRATFVNGSTHSDSDLDSIMSNGFDGIIHLAAWKAAGESMTNPAKYAHNNLIGTLNLLNACDRNGIMNIVFSSTSSVYGLPKYVPIDENHLQSPINPYGRSKLMIENILQDYNNAYDMKYISLRYFNAAGADIDCEIGEDHDPETHLIPLALDAAIGKREDIKLFGSDYETNDGSAIRDYIHVADIAQAHMLAFEYLERGGSSDSFNLGNGEGYSVIEIIDAVKRVTKKDFKVTLRDKRVGDPARLIGDASKAKDILKWKPKYCEIEKIIQTAWDWHQRNEDLI